MAPCVCGTLDELAVVHMGEDDLDQRFFATVERLLDHGGEQWWLYLSRCSICGQDWMVAQEERIYDDYFVKRLSRNDTEAILVTGKWPEDFLTYEAVLRVGRAHSTAFTFLDPRAGSLLWTVEDLRRERPEISAEEIGELLGISTGHASQLLRPEGLFRRIFRRLGAFRYA